VFRIQWHKTVQWWQLLRGYRGIGTSFDVSVKRNWLIGGRQAKRNTAAKAAWTRRVGHAAAPLVEELGEKQINPYLKSHPPLLPPNFSGEAKFRQTGVRGNDMGGGYR